MLGISHENNHFEVFLRSDSHSDYLSSGCRSRAGGEVWLLAHLQYALLGDFKLENGRSIDQCKIAYQTFGNLNKEK